MKNLIAAGILIFAPVALLFLLEWTEKAWKKQYRKMTNPEKQKQDMIAFIGNTRRVIKILRSEPKQKELSQRR